MQRSSNVSNSAAAHQPSAHLRMRPDLRIAPRDYSGARYWAVHDPVSDQYFLLRDEEYFVLKQLDGRTSVETIVRRFAERFAPRRLSTENCWNFLAQLYQDGLAMSDRPRVADHLLARARDQQRRRRFARWANVLFLRLPGWNPTRTFAAAHPYVQWIYTPWFLASSAVLILLSFFLVIFRWHDFAARWPDFYQLVASQNLALYAMAYAVIKVLHECAHGMTCIHFGGTVREIGVRLVLGFPCLYCDVSDCWMMPRRRHRIAVAAAGIGIELMIAALAGLVWWSTAPGLLHAVARSVMIVSSLGTILINGNPLMRFDGYFVLSDLVGVPNLWARSRQFWWKSAVQHGLGITLETDTGEPPASRGWMAAYGAVSMVYQLAVLLGIGWILQELLWAWHCEFLVPWLVTGLGAMLLWSPTARLVRLLRHPGAQSQLQFRSLILRFAASAALVAVLVNIPLPYRVTADAVIQARDAHPVYVLEAGALESAIRPGTHVQSGQILAQLNNRELQRDLLEAQAARDQQRIQVASLDVQRVHQDDAQTRRDRVVALRQLEVLNRRCQRLEQRFAELTLRAACSGTVFPPQLKSAQKQADRLPKWSGSPLDACNQDAWLEERTLLCTVGDPHHVEAWLRVDQSKIGAIHKGQHAVVYIEGVGGIALHGVVTDVAEVGLKVNADNSSQPAAMQQTWFSKPHRALRPVQRIHHVRIELDSETHPLLVGMQGRARIRVAGQSLATRLVQGWRTRIQFAACRLLCASVPLW